MKIKRIFEKIVICILLFLFIFNFSISPIWNINTSYAVTPDSGTDDESEGDDDDTTDDDDTDDDTTNADEDTTNAWMDSNTTGMGGILLSFIRVGIVAFGSGIQGIGYAIMSSAGTNEETEADNLSAVDIFFNKFKLVDVNIFKTGDVEEGSLVYKIRQNASILCWGIRAIAIGVLAFIAIFIVLKCLTATLADEKAKWKEMLFTLVFTAAMIGFIIFFISFIFYINDTIVDKLSILADATGVSDFMSAVKAEAQEFTTGQVRGWACVIIYFMLIYQTFIFGIAYIKRFLIVTFLVIISPIVPISYAIEKAQGKNATGFNVWFSEFCYNVFIQPIDCIIYLAVIGVSAGALSGSATTWESIAAGLMVVISLMCVKTLENLLKDIFGFNNSRMLTTYSSIINSRNSAIMTGVSMVTGQNLTNNSSISNISNTTTFGKDISGSTGTAISSGTGIRRFRF